MAKVSLPLSTFSTKQKGQHQSVSDRFWAKVRKTDSCWIWEGQTIKDGYGRIKVCGKNVLAHRLSFILANNREPSLQILHKCDNPPCVNPAHLFEGSPSDNALDKVRKGRQNAARGSSAGISKLTEADIPIIRQLLTDGIAQEKVAQKFGVSQVAISMVALGKTWKHVQ